MEENNRNLWLRAIDQNPELVNFLNKIHKLYDLSKEMEESYEKDTELLSEIGTYANALVSTPTPKGKTWASIEEVRFHLRDFFYNSPILYSIDEILPEFSKVILAGKSYVNYCGGAISSLKVPNGYPGSDARDSSSREIFFRVEKTNDFDGKRHELLIPGQGIVVYMGTTPGPCGQRMYKDVLIREGSVVSRSYQKNLPSG